MLTPDQKEFFELFGIAAPPGMSLDGAQRFMQAYLKDPERQQRWQQHLQTRPPAAAVAVAAAAAAAGAPAPAPAPQPAVTPRTVRVAPTIDSPRSVISASAPASPEAFGFTGSGGEYFGIWIVNLLLTIVTFGIYSAWAKVRRLQYFYRHTQLAGASFDYHGTGIAILKGRVIALGLFLAYNFSFQISILLGLVTLVALAVGLPWLLRSSLRFRLRNSSYRGLRFRFAGSKEGAYATFLGKPLLVFITAYLTVPWYHQQLKLYQHGNSWFGQTPFAFHATVGQFYKVYFLIWGLMLLVFVAPFGMMIAAMAELARATQESGAPPDPQAFATSMFLAFALMFAGMLAITPLWQAKLQNLIWNNTTFGPHRFESTISAWRLFGIHLSNLLLVVVTFGLYLPWAAVRVARYRAETLTLVAGGSLEDVVAHHEQDLGAAGEETADMFDIDIAL
jgi:uncharacterized membrane protein YjgN (DUF898 family)